MKNTIKQPVTKGVAKVPVIMQLEALECGAASLCMVLAYYNKWIPLPQVREDCGVCRDGSNASNVIKAARHYGLEAEGYKLELEDLKEVAQFPCIIHWNFNHFVVLDGFKNNKAYINDPGSGYRVISMEEFDRAYTGICLMFEPSEEFAPEGQPKSILSYVKKRIKGMESAIAFIGITTVLTSVASMISPVFNRVLFDRILNGQNQDWAKPFLYAILVIFALRIIATTYQQLALYRISGKVSVVSNLSFMWKVLNLPMRFFSQRMSGDILNRQSANVVVSNTLINVLAPLAFNSIMLIFYLVVMIRYSLILTIIGVLSVLINGYLSIFVTKKRVNITRASAIDEGKLYSYMLSGIHMINTIKSSGAEEGFFKEWSGYQANAIEREVSSKKLDTYWGSVTLLVSTLTSFVLMSVGILLTINGSFTLGMISTFQGLYTLFVNPANTFISAGQNIGDMRAHMERIEDIMEYPVDSHFAEEETSETDFDKLSGHIELKDVTFGYSPLGKPLIENFNLEINPGEKIAFVGPSGCGKSTISKLVSGLYQPKSGEILFDGKPINQIDKNVFTSSVAIVDQDIVVFEDTLANNIKMWDESIEDFEMILASRDAKLHDDIMMREGGYNTYMSEGGKNFSGGQRQRLEIARVLAQDPRIVILDEATSALDAKTEYEVVKAIKDRGITTIVIAHRLSTIRDCDKILVLDHGTIVECGTHEELMKKQGLYTSLVTNE